MLFNSLAFVFFLPIVFMCYWFLANKSLKAQNLLLVAASYIFYGWWDWRFLALIFFSSISDYLISIQLSKQKTQIRKKRFLALSVVINLATLFSFKYYNFFVENFVSLFESTGVPADFGTLDIILPIGISFYTFQSMSYTIEVYRGDVKPTRDLSVFLAYISFFPQLVAGPIERASHLIPQFYKKREFSYSESVDGLRQVLWGFVKKIVIADNCATYVNNIFDNYGDYSGSTLALGAFLFAFQIYGDFSGYSDIAIGTARLFGIDLMRNFSFPYFSRDIAEFWRRWHISLSTWFRDYLYIPLGGSKGGTLKKVRNTFIIFLVSGFWHGANWTFLAWGALNAIYFLPLLLSNRNRHNLGIVAQGRNIPKMRELVNMLFTFSLTVLAWIFFRADSISDAFGYFSGIFSKSFFSVPEIIAPKFRMIYVLLLVLVFILVEWLRREKKHVLQIEMMSTRKRWFVYSFTICIIILFARLNSNDFIYFQF